MVAPSYKIQTLATQHFADAPQPQDVIRFHHLYCLYRLLVFEYPVGLLGGMILVSVCDSYSKHIDEILLEGVLAILMKLSDLVTNRHRGELFTICCICGAALHQDFLTSKGVLS